MALDKKIIFKEIREAVFEVCGQCGTGRGELRAVEDFAVSLKQQLADKQAALDWYEKKYEKMRMEEHKLTTTCNDLTSKNGELKAEVAELKELRIKDAAELKSFISGCGLGEYLRDFQRSIEGQDDF